jgi:hypothetical protein
MRCVADFRPGYCGCRSSTQRVALHFMHYNLVRLHKTLKVTPAMAAGVTGKLWELADVVALLPDEDRLGGRDVL